MNTPSPQRDMSSSLYMSCVLLAMGILAVGMLAYVISGHAHQWYTWNRLQQGGVEVQGTVAGVESDRRGIQVIHYQYQARGKDQVVRTYLRREHVSRTEVDRILFRYRRGEQNFPVTVYYLPDNPAIARLAGTDTRGDAIMFIPAFLCAVPVFSLMVLGGVVAVVERIQRGPLDKHQDRVLYIGIAALVVLTLVATFLPPTENAMMRGIVSVRP